MEKPTLTDIQGVGKSAAERLVEAGYTRIDDIAAANPVKLAAVEGFTAERAQHIIDAAKILAGGEDDLVTPAATSATSPANPEVINMTTDKTEDKAAAETVKVEAKSETPKAETPKAEAAKPAAKPAAKKAPAKKAPAKKAAAKKPAAKTETKAAPKAAAAKPAAAKAAAKPEAAKPAEKPAAKPAEKPEAKAAPKPAPAPMPAPANTNTPSIFKEPGYIAAGVLLVLAVYGFAQQPSIQEYLGFSTDSSSSATTTAMTSEATAPDTSTATSAPSATANASAQNTASAPAASGDFGRPNMPTHMNPSMMNGMPNAPYGNPQFGGHPMYAPHMGAQQAATAPTDGVDDTAAADPNIAAQHVAPPPPYGPYSYSGNRLYNQGYGNGSGYGQGYGDGDFSMNFAGRANTQAYGNGYNGYNANSGYNGYNAYGPYGYGPYGYAPYGPGPAPYARPQAPAQAPVPAQ